MNNIHHIDNNNISVQNSYINGNYNYIQGSYNCIYGNYNHTRGSSCKLIGNYNKIHCSNTLVIGDYNHINGNNITIIGNYNMIRGQNNNVTSGKYNNGTFTYSNMNQPYDLFTIHQSDLKNIQSDLVEEKKDEIPITENDDTCIICYDNKKSVIFLPCAHLNTCTNCAKLILLEKQRCPICRNEIREMKNVIILKK